MEKKYIIMAAFVFSVLAMTACFIILAYYFKQNEVKLPLPINQLPQNNNSMDGGAITKGEIVEIAGTVTKYTPECFADGTCTVEIDDKYVIEVVVGMMPTGMGPEFGMNDVTSDDVGAKVKVRAKVVTPPSEATGGKSLLSIDEKNTTETFYILKITEHFACSDYCPDKPSKYQKIIFESIKTPEDCKKVGGIPEQYTGWGVTNICVVE